MAYLLGIDVGTSGTKTVLFNEKGQALSSYTGEYPLYQERNGWAEQDPEDWWQATCDGIKHVLSEASIDAKEIKGLGLSGQMHGLVLLDEKKEVLRKCIIWADQRTEKEVLEMEEKIGLDKVLAITANPPMTGFTAAKIMWVQNNEPELFAKARHILLPKDYIRFRLTNAFYSDVSDASGMQLMDVKNRVWSEEICQLLNIPMDYLPELVESQDIAGHVTKEVADSLGLPEGLIVVGGAADNAAAAIGTGVVKPGRAFTTIGTSAVVYAVTEEPHIDAEGRVHTLCASVPGRWTFMSCTQAAGLSLRWLRDTFFQEEMKEAEAEGIDVYEKMTALAKDVPIGARKLLFLPYLMGERSPYLDPNARGVFFGLSAIHEKKDFVRAVLEGVSYSQRQCVDVFRENNADVSDMILTGGGGRSPLWRQMLADLYGIPVKTLQADQGGALGAAILAGVGSGVYASLEEAVDQIVSFKDVLEPVEENSEAYEAYYALYKDLYQELKGSFQRLAKIEE